jgi:hypothetical protein
MTPDDDDDSQLQRAIHGRSDEYLVLQLLPLGERSSKLVVNVEVWYSCRG